MTCCLESNVTLQLAILRWLLATATTYCHCSWLKELQTTHIALARSDSEYRQRLRTMCIVLLYCKLHLYTRSTHKFAKPKLLFRDLWPSSNGCDPAAHRLVGASRAVEGIEPACRSSSLQLQVSSHELSCPSLEFTLGRPNWHGADHD